MADDTYFSGPVGVADNPTIDEVQDCVSGDLVPALTVLPRHNEELHLKRRAILDAINEGSPLYRCGYCGGPVSLRLECTKNRTGLHFKHHFGDGECEAKTRRGLSEERINALKYDGLKEGALHIETKSLLAESLKADSRFSDVQCEKTVKSVDGKKWRWPDVSAMFAGKLVAFEIQLATTFLSVIREREKFYRGQGMRLFWVFRAFDTTLRPAAIDDIFMGNNRNAFVVSPDTRNASVAEKRMTLECHWPEPKAENGNYHEIWQRRMVRFEEVQTDAEGRESFFDCDGARQKLRPSLLKRQIRDYCVRFELLLVETYEAEWNLLRAAATAAGFDIGERSREKRFRKLMCALLSLEEGKPVGFDFSSLVSIAHHIYDKHKPLLFYFMHAEKAYGHHDAFMNAGKEKKWRSRRAESCQKIASRDAAYLPDKTHDTLVRALFPKVGEHIDSTVAANAARRKAAQTDINQSQ